MMRWSLVCVVGIWLGMTATLAAVPSPHLQTSQPARLEFVRNMTLQAWNAYVDSAWGHDELRPLDHTARDWLELGTTILSSLDTLHIMGLHDAFEAARSWVKTDFNPADKDVIMNFFEVTIRVLGGLLGAFEVDGDRMFLEKADDLAQRLLPVFHDSHSRVPRRFVNLKTGATSGTEIGLAEFGTITLEFAYLSKHTNKPEYRELVESLIAYMKDQAPQDWLYPQMWSADTGQPLNKLLTFGSGSDSFYEYLLKMWLLTGMANDMYVDLYDKSIEGMMKRLLRRSSPNQLYYIAKYDGDTGKEIADFEHLSCFAGAMLVLGNRALSQWDAGSGITETCYEMYHRQDCHIAPDMVTFEGPNDFFATREYYWLRPEAVESIFYMYRLTRDTKYRDWGWDIAQALAHYCSVPNSGYTRLSNITQMPPIQENQQDAYFLSETVKYLYLLFEEESVLPFDTVVFTTEAHPLGIWSENTKRAWKLWQIALLVVKIRRGHEHHPLANEPDDYFIDAAVTAH